MEGVGFLFVLTFFATESFHSRPTMSDANLNNHANQLNPNSDANKAGADNRSNQMNPNHSASKGSGGKSGSGGKGGGGKGGGGGKK
jgi:uncharacterized membrane protein YgcG